MLPLQHPWLLAAQCVAFSSGGIAELSNVEVHAERQLARMDVTPGRRCSCCDINDTYRYLFTAKTALDLRFIVGHRKFRIRLTAASAPLHNLPACLAASRGDLLHHMPSTCPNAMLRSG